MFKIIVLLSLIFTSIFSQEAEEFDFLGFIASKQSIDFNTLSQEDETTFGIRYGQQTLDWRTMFSYEYKSSSFQSFSMEIDKILLDSMMGKPEIRPYTGVSVGTLKYENLNVTDTSGYTYGVHVGLILYAKDNIDIDLSYHYLKAEGFQALDKVQGISFAIHYFF